MSQEDVELYRRGIEAFNRRDPEAFLALADPDVVGIARMLAAERPSYRGDDGTREQWKTCSMCSLPSRIEVGWVRDPDDLTVSELRCSASEVSAQRSLWSWRRRSDDRTDRHGRFTAADEVISAGLREQRDTAQEVSQENVETFSAPTGSKRTRPMTLGDVWGPFGEQRLRERSRRVAWRSAVADVREGGSPLLQAVRQRVPV